MTMTGGVGNDVLRVGDGNSTISGNEGNDLIQARNGANSLSGGTGNDSIAAGSGTSTIDGDDGNDVMSVTGGLVSMYRISAISPASITFGAGANGLRLVGSYESTVTLIFRIKTFRLYRPARFSPAFTRA